MSLRRKRLLPTVLCCTVLSGCNVYETARSDQQLGDALGVGAWVDPRLMPISGCDALNRTWSNQGNLVRDGDVRPAALTAALGLAEEAPDSAFADAVSIVSDGEGVSITAMRGDGVVASRKVPAAHVQCDVGYAAFELGGEKRRVAIDASGALWVGEHRFPRPGAARCRNVGWTISAPDGLATVVPSVGATLLESANSQSPVLVRSTAMSMGVKVFPSGVFYLSGDLKLAASVYLRPESRWQFRLESVNVGVERSLAACHSYLLIGGADPNDRVGTTAWAALVDMGDDFDWKACRLTADSTRVRLEGDAVYASSYCFAAADGDRLVPINGLPRGEAVN